MSTVTRDERGAAGNGIGVALRTQVQLWLAVLFMALAFGAGLTIGVIAQHTESQVIGVTQTDQVPSNFGVAPPLTDQQIQQGLPSGHPAVGTSQGSNSSGSSSGSSTSGNGDSASQQGGASSGPG